MDHPADLVAVARPDLRVSSSLDVTRNGRADPATLAREFEAMLMLEMIRQMRQSVLGESEELDGLGAGPMTDTIDLELARHLAGQGGMGLAAALGKAFDRELGAVPAAEAGGGAVASPDEAGDRVHPARPVEPADVREPEGLRLPFHETTSSFGWRTDPIAGGRRFHAGVDLRAAYGTEVPAAAQGIVERAGEESGYGLTIVLQHADGLETRYAHLSSLDVRVGEEVRTGQVIGRVGSTGRATGPHLHFEVTRDGERVDPARVATRLPVAAPPELKAGHSGVDSSHVQLPGTQVRLE